VVAADTLVEDRYIPSEEEPSTSGFDDCFPSVATRIHLVVAIVGNSWCYHMAWHSLDFPFAVQDMGVECFAFLFLKLCISLS